MAIHSPSMTHLEAHQRDINEYRHNVASSAPHRYDSAWWGTWEHGAALEENGVVVDLGAGSGHLLTEIRRRYPHARLVGVELHPVMLDLFREAAAVHNLEVVHADLGAPLPLPEAFADVVTSVLSFHELPHPPVLLANAAHILKPGGRLILHDIVKYPLREYVSERKDGRIDEDALAHYREHCLFSPDDLQFLATHHGFTVTDVFTRSRGRFATVLARKN